MTSTTIWGKKDLVEGTPALFFQALKMPYNVSNTSNHECSEALHWFDMPTDQC